MTKDPSVDRYSPLLALFAVAPGLRRATDHTLSLYLPARAEGYDARHYDIVFGDVLHRYRERLGDDGREVLEVQMPRLRTHLATAKPAGCPAIAAFAQSEPNVLEVVPLPLSTAERLEVGDALIAPALRQLEQVPPALIAVVDKEQAQIFGSILGTVFAISEIAGHEVRHSRAGGTSAPSNQRKAENRAHVNLEVVVAAVIREMSSGAYADIYTAGPGEARAEFDGMLHEALRASIAGHLGVSLDSATLLRDIRQALAGPHRAARAS